MYQAASQELMKEAEPFLTVCYTEWGRTGELPPRLAEVEEELLRTGTYTPTAEELAYGARLAWRNSNRCIGRLFWKSLQVADCRELEDEEAIFAALVRHIVSATNQGKIVPTLTVFAPETPGRPAIRLWNHQLIRYAGYSDGSGRVTGDPASVRLTQAAERLGWRGRGTPFDVLPLILQVGDRPPRWFELPEDAVLQVPIRHPEFAWFEELQLQWYAVPLICDLRLELGGLRFPCAPFNGWYMETEIGARNFADQSRYDLLPAVAARMGLDTSTNVSLWKDKALVELNVAVLQSYKQAGVSIVDHHTAAEQFQLFERLEASAGRRVTGDWSWLIPPVSPATTGIWHKGYDNEVVRPGFFAQSSPY